MRCSYLFCFLNVSHSAQMNQQNLSRFLHLLDTVVKKAPNLLKLKIPSESTLFAEKGVAQNILNHVAKLKQLQALDIPGFHCSLKDVVLIAYLMPNLRYTILKSHNHSSCVFIPFVRQLLAGDDAR
jgi:hypothetical protein